MATNQKNVPAKPTIPLLGDDAEYKALTAKRVELQTQLADVRAKLATPSHDRGVSLEELERQARARLNGAGGEAPEMPTPTARAQLREEARVIERALAILEAKMRSRAYELMVEVSEDAKPYWLHVSQGLAEALAAVGPWADKLYDLREEMVLADLDPGARLMTIGVERMRGADPDSEFNRWIDELEREAAVTVPRPARAATLKRQREFAEAEAREQLAQVRAGRRIMAGPDGRLLPWDRR